jgi:hypothetical protein
MTSMKGASGITRTMPSAPGVAALRGSATGDPSGDPPPAAGAPTDAKGAIGAP